MKGRIVALTSVTGGRPAAALLVNGVLEDLIVDAGDGQPLTGEIFAATVIRRNAKAGGAFLDLGCGASGFLRDAKGTRDGERVLVQVASQPEPGKAVPVSTRVLYKHRLLIHTPGAPGINVSRQIKDPEERDRLTAGVERAASPFLDVWRAEGEATLLDDAAEKAARRRQRIAARGRMLDDGGIIVRAAAEGAPGEIIAEALEWPLAARAEAEALLRGGENDTRLPHDAWQEAITEWCHPLPDQLLADGSAAALIDAQTAEGRLDDALAGRVTAARGDPFDALGVWDMAATLSAPKVDLAGGGSIVIEPTTALVAIDVNTGGDFGPDAGVRANVEAARLLPRLLRLRGLGGQVVVDFAPMAKKERRRLEDALKAALKRDPIETAAHGFSTMGLYELQRKRERRPLVLPFA
ncbi:MAG: ribonuclease E/G [Pseudomonadota bacterium]